MYTRLMDRFIKFLLSSYHLGKSSNHLTKDINDPEVVKNTLKSAKINNKEKLDEDNSHTKETAEAR